MRKMTSFEELGGVFGLKGSVFSSTKKEVRPKKKPKTPTVSASGATYKTLGVFEGTVMKVPKKSGFMTYEPATCLSNGDIVSEHWHNGKPLGAVFFNVFFYGITSKNLGQRIVGTAEVIEKTCVDGKKFIMMNFYHTPEASCRYNFAMPKDGTGDFIIDESVEERLAFRPRKHDKLRL